MPRKPSAATINAAKANITGQDVVTSILAEDPALAARAEQAGIVRLAQKPGETRQTVALVDDNTSILGNLYNFIMGYEPNRNAFLYALMNRIGMTLITSRMWNSPLAWTLRGRLEFGESVEEIFVNLVKVQSFDPKGLPGNHHHGPASAGVPFVAGYRGPRSGYRYVHVQVLAEGHV